MRQVVLDTETTGLEVSRGDRVIEIGCIEIVDRRLTGRRFHQYVNPEREVEAGALAVHGLDDEFLRDKPKFGEICEEFIEFVGGAELVIHNAAFDLGFLDYELGLAGRPRMSELAESVIDTLKLAREMHPGRKNSLAALCERYCIDHSRRTLHGALLDAQLLAEVYLAMTRGQESLIMEFGSADRSAQPMSPGMRAALPILRPSEEELREHERVLHEIERESHGRCIWLGAQR